MTLKIESRALSGCGREVRGFGQLLLGIGPFRRASAGRDELLNERPRARIVEFQHGGDRRTPDLKLRIVDQGGEQVEAPIGIGAAERGDGADRRGPGSGQMAGEGRRKDLLQRIGEVAL